MDVFSLLELTSSCRTVDPDLQTPNSVIGTLRRVGGGGVGGLNAHNKDLIRPI